MRMIAALVTVAASIASLALATEDRWAPSPPTAVAEKVPQAAKTEPDSPYVEDHRDHQQAYSALTWAIYDTVNYAAPASANLPEANDADGHPMWFDAGVRDDI